MVERVTTQTVGGTQTVSGLLCRHDHLVKGKRTLMHDDLQVIQVLAYIDFEGNGYITEARDLQNIFSRLYIGKSELSVKSGSCPKIVFSKSECSSDNWLTCRIFRHGSGQGTKDRLSRNVK
jgi:hypothetical protein